MPAARYEDWTHVRVIGERADAQPHLSFGRKVLGAVMEDAQRNGLGVHSMRRELSDGTIVIAEKIGDIPRITIVPAPKSGRPPPKAIAEDFVVWASDVDDPLGLDSEFPQQILQQGDAGWKTFFYDGSVEGYNDFARTKGTYKIIFPEGLRRAGNVDWVSKKQLRISWYGPSSRYWPDAYVQPRSQFGKFVFMLGERILDTDEYATDSPGQMHGDDRYIMGAALKRASGSLWLYTVQSEALNEPSPSFGTNRAANTRPYSQSNNDGGMYRYRLYTEVDAAGVSRYRVVPESRELMFAYNNHAEPWFFNQSCTKAHCYELPAIWYAAVTQPFPPDPSAGAVPILPSGTQTFQSVTIDDDAAVLDEPVELGVQCDNVHVPIATDYAGDVRRDMTIRWEPTSRDTWFKFDDLEHAHKSIIYTYHGEGIGGAADRTVGWDWSWIAHANLRDNVLILRRDDHRSRSNTGNPEDSAVILGAGQCIEVWRGSAIEVLHVIVPDAYTTVDFVPAAPSMGRFNALTNTEFTELDGNTLPPSFFMYGIVNIMSGVFFTYNYITEFYGAVAGYTWAPYPAAAMFGTFYNSGAIGNTGQAYADQVYGQAQGNRADFDGHYGVLACSTTEQTVMLSMWEPAEGSGAESFFHVTDDTLPSLTGVTGSNNRYHPLWLLGKPPAA